MHHELFDEVLARYNEKQTWNDRQIDDYYEKILSSKQEKPFYEIIVQIGDKDNMGAKTEDGQFAGKILGEYMKGFQKRMQKLASMVKDMEYMAAKFSDNPKQVLPEAGIVESGRAYREKKAKPVMQKIVKVLRSVYAPDLDVSRKFDKLQLSYNRTVEKANNLSHRFHQVYTENQELKEIVRDYECVRAVLGKEKVSGIMQMEK